MNDSINKILSDYGDIIRDYNQIESQIQGTDETISARIDVCDNTDKIIQETDSQFLELTSIINKKDIPFLIFSILLQVGVKYLIKELREMDDRKIAKKMPFHTDEHSSRLNSDYYVSIDEIIANPVPFDAIQKAHDNSWYSKVELPGFNGFNHRATAIGHDPLLGLVFGTANIMTGTITRNDFISWHVKTLPHQRTKRNGENYFAYLDTIADRASTVEIFQAIVNRIKTEGKEGYKALGCSLLKEIVHLCSDLPGKQSLPLPVVSTFDEHLARELSLYGINAGTIVQGGIAVKLINWLIAFLHGLTKAKSEDEKIFKVRTKKILMYSNLIATCSDLGYTLFSAYLGDKNAMRKFDLGGYLVTLSQICTSYNVIIAIETEFKVNSFIQEFNKVKKDR